MNNNIIKRFLNTSFVYFVGNVSTKLISFFLIPVYTTYLNPAEFGEYDLIISIINLVVPLVFFQIWDGVFRFAFDDDSILQKKTVLDNGLVIMWLGIVILTVTYLLLAIFYPSFFNVWVILYGMLFAFQYYYTVVTRIHLDNKLFSITGVVNTFIAAVFNIILIKYYHLGVDSLYISACLGILVQIVIIEMKMKPLLSFSRSLVNINLIKNMILFSLPLCISTVSYWMLNGYTKIMITNILGTYENGLYAITNKFTSLILLVVSVFQFAWNEMVYLLSKDDNQNKIYEKGICMIFKITLISAAFFIFVSRLIFPFFVNAQYSGSISILPVSMVAVAANSFASFTGTLFLANKKSSALLSTTILAVTTNVILTNTFIYYFKLTGALIALSLAMIILVLSRLYMLKKQYDIILSNTCYYSLLFFAFSIISFYFIDDKMVFLLLIIQFLIGIILMYKDIKEILIKMKEKR